MSSFKKISLITFGVIFFNFLYTNAVPIPESITLENSTCQSKPVKFLFHNTTQKCYKEKSKGPCPSNMAIFPIDKGSVFGDCDCTENGYLPWAYHPASHNCYKTYEQSNCPAGQWLVFDDELYPACKPNPCLDNLSQDEDAPTVLFENKCVTLGSSDFCGNPSEKVGFLPNEVIPKCVSSIADITNYALTKIKTLPCRPGTLRDISGRCRRKTTVINVGTEIPTD